MSLTPKQLGSNLKEIRNDSDISQQVLAESLNVDRSCVSRWETGKSVPDAIEITRIADALNVPINRLLK